MTKSIRHRFRISRVFFALAILSGISCITLTFIAIWTTGDNAGRFGGSAAAAFFLMFICAVVGGVTSDEGM